MSFDTSFLPPDAAAYLAAILPAPFPNMARVEKDIQAERRPAVGRQTGSALRALALTCGAKRILEVGTNVGYSGLWLCAGLAPGGRFEGIEIDDDLADRANANLREALGTRAEIVIHRGAALDVLPRLEAGKYDLIFLDAVKSEYPYYLDHALRLLRPGGVLAADNIFWRGAVWTKSATDDDTVGVREYTRRIFADKRLTSTILPVEDGLSVSVLTESA